MRTHPIYSLTVNSSNLYQITGDFSTSIPSEKKLLVRVMAKFQNGAENIDECQSIVLSNAGSSYGYVMAEIRGSIDNYSSTSQNYLVEIYQTQP